MVANLCTVNPRTLKEWELCFVKKSHLDNFWGVTYTPLAVSDVVLPPYVKHSYPSYPDTENKKSLRRNSNYDVIN